MIKSFVGGFVIGFGSGVAFRALAEKDFESLKEMSRTSLNVAQKIGDSVAESFGRLRETAEDYWALLRADRLKAGGHKSQRAASHQGRSSRKRRASTTQPRELHS